MASVKIKVELPEDITGITGFVPEHQLVWQTIHAMNYKFTDRGWLKGSGQAKDAQAIAMMVLNDNKAIPLALTRIIDIIKDMERMWPSIEAAARGESDKMMNAAAEWLKAYGDLAKLRFSSVDEKIWTGLAHTIDSEGRHVVVAPTGRANEYRVVGCNAKEVYQWFYSVNMPGTTISRMSYVESHIVDVILELTEGLGLDDCTPRSCLHESKFPASVIRSLITKEPVTNSEGKFLGFKLNPKNGCKITAFDYIESAFESFAAREKFRIASIVPLSNDPDEPCYRYLDISSSAAGSWKHWDDWMKETFELDSAKDIFMAWCGSLLDAQNSGKQCLWLHGHGNDGKSKVAGALIKYLGTGAVALNGMSMTNQFGLAKLEGKRLVVMADAKNKKLLQSEWAHNLTGGDSVDIERKGKNSYSQMLIGKLMICANFAPEIRTDEVNQVSRLIYVKMKKRSVEDSIKKGLMKRMPDGSVGFIGDNSFQGKLDAEVGAFMRACVKVYEDRAPTHSDIPLGREMMEAIESGAADPAAEGLHDLAYDFFDFDGMGEVSVRDVTAIVNDNARAYGLAITNFLQSDFNSFLTNHGAKKVRGPEKDGRRERVWRGITLKQSVGL